jgi:hypothetical protein
MPTPDDVVSPAEHERATCPPEDTHTSTAHEELSTTRDSSASRNVDSSQRPRMQQQPTPPPHGSREQSPTETHSKPSSASIEAPNRDIPTPMTAIDENAEDQRASQASPLSAIAPAPIRYNTSQLAAPYPAHRVCLTRATPLIFRTLLTNVRRSFSPTHRLRSSVLVADSRAARPPTVSSTKWTLR